MHVTPMLAQTNSTMPTSLDSHMRLSRPLRCMCANFCEVLRGLLFVVSWKWSEKWDLVCVSRTCLWYVTTVAALRGDVWGCGHPHGWRGDGGGRGACGASFHSLAAPLYLPVGGSRSRGPGWLATALCAGVLPNDADTAHGAQVFPMCTVLAIR